MLLHIVTERVDLVSSELLLKHYLLRSLNNANEALARLNLH